MTAELLWLDMEMTGLDPESCVPIEVAMIATDGHLRELDRMEAIIWQPEQKLAEMVPIVRSMHTTNGLLDRQSEQSLDQVEREMLVFIARWFSPKSAILAGNSIHQDRRFIARYFPGIDRYLHYRMVDVSTIKVLAQRWYPDMPHLNKGPADHTALADVRASIDELSHYRKHLFQNAKLP